MTLNNQSAGELYAAAYQVSSHPWVTSSQVSLGEIKELTFPQISRFVTIQNKSQSSTIAVGFTRRGFLPANSNYFLLSGSESYSGELRLGKLFLSGVAGASVPFAVIAGLTSIPAKNLTPLTGSTGFEGVG